MPINKNFEFEGNYLEIIITIIISFLWFSFVLAFLLVLLILIGVQSVIDYVLKK